MAGGPRPAVTRALGLDVNRREIVGAETVPRGVPLDGTPHFPCVLDPCLRLSRFAVEVTLVYLASGDPAALAR